MDTPATDTAANITDAEAIDLWGFIMRGTAAASRRLNDALKAAFSINEAEADSLIVLGGLDGHSASMATLASSASFSSGGYTKIADRLTKRGFVRRVPCENDRRVTYLELTESGISLAEEVRCLVAEINRAQVIDVIGVQQTRAIARASEEIRAAVGPTA